MGPLTENEQCTILGGLSVGYQELICIIMAALICEPKDIGLASGFLGSWKQVSGSIASMSENFLILI